MKLRIKILFLLLLYISCNSRLISEETVLTESDFLKLIANNHPVAKMAQIAVKKGNQEVRRAAGMFDPELSAQYSSKNFDNKSYYDKLLGGLTIPSWYGPDFILSYESAAGNYINPENNLPNNGLVSAGINLPLGQGLFIDKRRAAYKQSEIFEKISEVEQIRILSDLYLEATNQYWEWAASYNKVKITETALNVTKNRFSAIKQAFIQGDIAAIDTLEAYLQLLNLEINYQSAKNDYFNQSMMLSTFLWNENQMPLELSSTTIPQISSIFETPDFGIFENYKKDIDSLVSVHPEVTVYDLKIEQLDVERDLKLDLLKPKLNLKYNFLNQALNPLNSSFELNTNNNFKFGIDFNMPLFLRTERSELELANLKLLETELERKNKTLQLKYKAITSLNELEILINQYKFFFDAVNSYQILFETEKIKFDIGESSQFLIISRENSLLNAKIKQIELYSKILSKFASVKWSLGIIAK